MAQPLLEPVRSAITQLRSAALEREARLAHEIDGVHPLHRAAARNLAHYLALRQQDLRELQRSLSALGLSSLGRSERCVLATLDAVSHALACLAGAPEPFAAGDAPVSFDEADDLLSQRALALLGAKPSAHTARIMITLRPDADAAEVEQSLAAGIDVIRLNFAKGGEEAWDAVIKRVRLAARRRGKECKILCDLAGPNPRTLDLGRGAPRSAIGKLGAGDRLLLARSAAFRAPRDMPVVGCTLPQILDDLRCGERLFYDDGKLAGVVREINADGAVVEVTFARKERVKLKQGKGLNFPDTNLSLPLITEKDAKDIQYIARHADLVGLSFVRGFEQVAAVQAELDRLGAKELGLILKIETVPAFRSLPRLLFTAMQSPRIGIMVARGDMAIEMGFERLAEAQEEILWLCEAAFIPVIWATQVLDTLNHTGMPSRAEVTDAAMASRAECVMLNQGEHQIEALRFLHDVLARMDRHQHKKSSMLHRLAITSAD